MEESSRPQVTITFGRSGQVVKRAGAVLDRDISDPVIGTKRSIRDRLGTAVDSVNKRSRGDDGRWNLKAKSFVDDLHLSKDDLRFKIMKRTQTTVDLRDMLSRRARPSTTKLASQNLHEPRHGRQITPDIRDERRHIPEPRDPRNLPEPRDPRNMHDQRDPRHIREPRERQMPESRNERPYMLEQRDDRRRMPESRDDICSMGGPLEVRQHMPKLNGTRHRILEPTNDSMTSHFTSMRTSEASSQMDYLRNSYSPWTLDHIRRKSPDLNTSRGLSPPPRRTEETQRRPIIRAYEAPKSVTYGSRDVSEIPRSMTTTSFISKPPLSVGPMKSVGPLVTTRSTPLLSGGSMQRSQYPVAENLTVEGFLRSLGLEKYLISFKVEEVDMAALSQMGDHDLKDMGIPMGPRKKILLALLARARGQLR